METQASVAPNTAGLVSFSAGAAGSCKFSTCARVTQQNDLNMKPDKGHFQFQWGITMGDTVTNGDINGDIQLIPLYPMIIWDIWRARHVQFPLQIELCSMTWSPRQGMHPPLLQRWDSLSLDVANGTWDILGFWWDLWMVLTKYITYPLVN